MHRVIETEDGQFAVETGEATMTWTRRAVAASREDAEKIARAMAPKKVNNYQKWTDDDVRILRELHASGASARGIGDAMGRTRDGIVWKIKQLKLDFSHNSTPQTMAMNAALRAKRAAE